MSPLILDHHYQHGWLLYMLNLINNYINQYGCHHSHYCRTGLPANYHHQLQKTWHISLPFTINGPGTESDDPSDIKLMSLVQFIVDRSNSTADVS